MPATSDRDHWFIDARVYGHRVEETHYVTDPARNIRKREQKKVWHVKKSLGSGGFGKVHLEESQEDRQLRAVKVIDIGDRELSKIECEREIEALLEFSKPRALVSQEYFSESLLIFSSSRKQECLLNSWGGFGMAHTCAWQWSLCDGEISRAMLLHNGENYQKRRHEPLSSKFCLA